MKKEPERENAGYWEGPGKFIINRDERHIKMAVWKPDKVTDHGFNRQYLVLRPHLHS